MSRAGVICAQILNALVPDLRERFMQQRSSTDPSGIATTVYVSDATTNVNPIIQHSEY